MLIPNIGVRKGRQEPMKHLLCFCFYRSKQQFKRGKKRLRDAAMEKSSIRCLQTLGKLLNANMKNSDISLLQRKKFYVLYDDVGNYPMLIPKIGVRKL